MYWDDVWEIHKTYFIISPIVCICANVHVAKDDDYYNYVLLVKLKHLWLDSYEAV